MMNETAGDDKAGRRPKLGYLSAAPTVSTRNEAVSAGPRAHILGVIKGFRAAGFEVDPFIVGDRLAPALGRGQVQGLLERSALLRYAGDIARLVMGHRAAGRAFADFGASADWVYERFATMQVMGRRFQRAGIPWILETQGLFYYETRRERQNVGWSGLARRVEIAAYRDCDVLVCISEPLKLLLVRECGIDPDKILVVPNAVDLDRFDPGLPTPPRANDRLSLVFIGGLIQWQALDFLLETIAELRDEGLPVDLRIVGTGAMEKTWKELSRTLGLNDQVHFTGHVDADAVAGEIARADLGYAGAREMAIGAMYHSPIKLYEYMAMARPVIAAAHDDARSLVEGQDTGFLFRPEDKDDLKRCLREAQQRRGELAAMGSRARALIGARHSWTVRTADMIEGIRRKLAGRTAIDSQSATVLATCP